MRRAIPPFLACCLLSGCGAADPTVPRREEVAPVSRPGWTEQIAAVRAGTATRIVVSDETVEAGDLAGLANGCDALEVLDLDDVTADMNSLSAIARLPHLERLKLGAPVDDAGIEQLVGARQLTVVNLPQATFSDRGLELLAELPRLELLRFHSPNVTDAGLSHIARMPALRFLHLVDVPVTDAGLAHLHGMRQLESFYLDGGGCTEEGLRALLAALPELHFHLDQLHLPGDPLADPHASPELPPAAGR